MASRVIATILNLKDNFSRTINNVTKNTKGFQNQINHTQNAIKEMQSKAVDTFKSISAASGIALSGGLVSGIVAGNNLNDTLLSLQNQTGLTGKYMGQMREVLLQIYKDGYGESFQDIADTIRLIGQQGAYSKDKVKEMAESALMIKKNFGFEVNESFRSAKMLMDQFGVSAETAYSLIAQGAQYGLDKNGDLLDTINEYSVHFKQLGLSSDEMFNMLNNGTKTGTFSVDKLGDAIKEFGIRVKDDSKGTIESFQQLGLNANTISSEFAKGGSEGRKAFSEVINALFKMSDPLNQNQIGVALFGTMWEDLGKDGIKALTDMSGELESTDTALKKIKANDMESLTMQFKKIKNSIIANVMIPLGKNLQPVIEKVINVLKGSPEAINSAFNSIGQVFNILKPIVEWLLSHVDLVKAAFIGLGAGIGAVGIVSQVLKVMDTINDVKKALNGLSAGASGAKKLGTIFQTIFKLPPTALLFIAGVALIAGAAYLIYKNWEPIKKFFSGLWEGIKSAFNGFMSWFQGILAGIGAWINNNVQWIKNTVTSKWNNIKTDTINKFNEIKTGISNVITNIGNSIKNKFAQIKTSISSAVIAIKATVISIFQSIVAAVTSNPIFIIVEAIFKGILAIIILMVARIIEGWTRIFTAVANILRSIWIIVVSVWNSIVSTVSSIVINIWSIITNIWNSIYLSVSSVLTATWNTIVLAWTTIYNSVVSILTTLWNYIVTIWNTIYSSITGVLILIWSIIVTQWNNIYNGIVIILTSVWNAVTTIWNTIYGSVSSVVSSIWSTIVSGFNNAYSGVTSIFNNMYGTIVGIFQNIWGVVKSIINNGISMVNGFIGGVNNVIGKANKLPGVNIGAVSTIPALATGGVTTGPTLAMIGEGKEQEAVLPLSKLQNLINTGNTDSKGQSKKVGNTELNIQVIIQGNVIGNEEFIDEVGNAVTDKVILALDNM